MQPENASNPQPPNPQPLAQQTQTFMIIETRTLLFAASKQVSPARPLLRNNGSCRGWSQGGLPFPPQTGLKQHTKGEPYKTSKHMTYRVMKDETSFREDEVQR